MNNKTSKPLWEELHLELPLKTISKEKDASQMLNSGKNPASSPGQAVQESATGGTDDHPSQAQDSTAAWFIKIFLN